jgi:hypothetical protein
VSRPLRTGRPPSSRFRRFASRLCTFNRASIHAGIARRSRRRPRHYTSDIERGRRNVAIINLAYVADAFGLIAAKLLRAADF